MNDTAQGKAGEAAAPARRGPRWAWAALLAGEGRASRVAGGGLLATFVVLMAWILGAEGGQTALPYTDDDLGTFAVGTLKADRDYRLPDPETTDAKREDARARTRVVYDFDAGALDRQIERLRQAFEGARTLRLEPEIEVEAQGEGAPDLLLVARDSGAPRLAGAVATSLAGALEISLSPAQLEALAAEGPSVALEEATVALLREGMAAPVVATFTALSAERARGLVLRPVPARGVRDERIVSDLDAELNDLAGARARLARRVEGASPPAAARLQQLAFALARPLVQPTLTLNQGESLSRQALAAQSVRPSFIEVKRGEKIIGDGEAIERRHLAIVSGIRAQRGARDHLRVYLGAALLVSILGAAFFIFARRGVWRFQPSQRDLLFLAGFMALTLAAIRGGVAVAAVFADQLLGVPPAALYFGIPAASAVLLVRLALPGEVTLFFAALLAIFSGVIVDGDLSFVVYIFVGGMVGADRISRARDRGGIWQAGLVMAGVHVVLIVALALFGGELQARTLFVGSAAGVVAGVLAPLLVIGLAMGVERLFGYTTDLRLLELANLNHPLLKELVVAAPGTYHHSMVIGAMVEPAAEAIGANPLLARVGAYYHDIGKGRAAHYFAENQRGGENAHDKLNPSMSALIIRRHVSEGIKMAEAAGLPGPVVDCIPMHHGTRLMAYFWHKSKEEAAQRDEVAPEETEFRHMGPKPRFREAALLMIADSVEAASRSLAEPTPDRLRGLVQKVINACFADGQFDECDITLKDLHAATRAFVTSLSAIYHTRPEYQQPADKQRAPAQGAGDQGDAARPITREEAHERVDGGEGEALKRLGA